MLTADWFVGVDWASEAHAICIVDREGRICDQREVKHTAAALQAWIDDLVARASDEPSRIAVGIEVPRGAVVELLVERGFPVYAINPKQLAFETGLPWRARKTIVAMRWSLAIRCAPTRRRFDACASITPW